MPSGRNCQKEGGHTSLVLSEVEKPHLACKEGISEGKKNNTDLQSGAIKLLFLVKKGLGQWCAGTEEVGPQFSPLKALKFLSLLRLASSQSAVFGV